MSDVEETESSMAKLMPARMCQARWFWTGTDDNEDGKLELYIPTRNKAPEVVIEARINTDMTNGRGTWEVRENGVLVALGEMTAKDDLLWREGDGPMLEAERVVCYGASALDTLRVKAYLNAGMTAA